MDLIIELVEEGQVSEEWIDFFVCRVFRDKFKLGFFDDLYVDLDKVDIVG